MGFQQSTIHTLSGQSIGLPDGFTYGGGYFWILLGTSPAKIRKLDTNLNFVEDISITIPLGGQVHTQPHGLAFYNNKLYIGSWNDIYVFTLTGGRSSADDFINPITGYIYGLWVDSDGFNIMENSGKVRVFGHNKVEVSTKALSAVSGYSYNGIAKIGNERYLARKVSSGTASTIVVYRGQDKKYEIIPPVSFGGLATDGQHIFGLYGNKIYEHNYVDDFQPYASDRLESWVEQLEYINGGIGTPSTSIGTDRDGGNTSLAFISGGGAYNYLGGVIKTFNKLSYRTWDKIVLDYITRSNLIGVADNNLRYKIYNASDDSLLLSGDIYLSSSEHVYEDSDHEIDLSTISDSVDSIKVFIHFKDTKITNFGNEFNIDNVSVKSLLPVGSAVVSSAPTGLVASTESTTQINLAWVLPANNGGASITGYKIYRRLSTTSQYTVIVADTGNDSLVYADTGLTANKKYVYKVAAINSAGTSVDSETAFAHTIIPVISSIRRQDPTASTTKDTTVKFRVVFSNDVENVSTADFSAGDSGEVTGVNKINNTTYDVLVSVDEAGPLSLIVVDGNDIAYADGGKLNNALPSINQSYIITVPSNPTGLRATVSGEDVSLTWNNPNDPSITGYQILRKTRGVGGFAIIVQNTGSVNQSYTDDTVGEATSYTYRVKAISTAGISGQSRFANVTTPLSITVSGVPTSLTVSVISSTQINLKWIAPVNNGGAPIDGYKIERKIGTGSYAVLVEDTNNTSVTYNNTGLTASTKYTYRVFARNSVGISSESNEAVATTKAAVVVSKLDYVFKYDIVDIETIIPNSSPLSVTRDKIIAK